MISSLLRTFSQQRDRVPAKIGTSCCCLSVAGSIRWCSLMSVSRQTNKHTPLALHSAASGTRYSSSVGAARATLDRDTSPTAILTKLSSSSRCSRVSIIVTRSLRSSSNSHLMTQYASHLPPRSIPSGVTQILALGTHKAAGVSPPAAAGMKQAGGRAGWRGAMEWRVRVRWMAGETTLGGLQRQRTGARMPVLGAWQCLRWD